MHCRINVVQGIYTGEVQRSSFKFSVRKVNSTALSGDLIYSLIIQSILSDWRQSTQFSLIVWTTHEALRVDACTLPNSDHKREALL